MAYAVSTTVFEGPFDLLLHLISREEVDIYDVALADIVDAYLAELARMESLDLDVATEFLLIAATLVELKARRLLPGRDAFEIDEELLYEERDLLLARLLEAKTFKDAARALEAMREGAGRSVPRTMGPEEPFASLRPDPLEQAGLRRFVAAAERAFAPRDAPHVSLEHVTPIRVTVRDAIDAVLARLPDDGSVTFRALTADARDRIEVVVRFLAVLELYKRGVVEIDQPTVFGDLAVSLAGDTAGIDLDGLDEWDEPVDLAALGAERGDAEPVDVAEGLDADRADGAAAPVVDLDAFDRAPGAP